MQSQCTLAIGEGAVEGTHPSTLINGLVSLNLDTKVDLTSAFDCHVEHKDVCDELHFRMRHNFYNTLCGTHSFTLLQAFQGDNKATLELFRDGVDWYLLQ